MMIAGIHSNKCASNLSPPPIDNIYITLLVYIIYAYTHTHTHTHTHAYAHAHTCTHTHTRTHVHTHTHTYTHTHTHTHTSAHTQHYKKKQSQFFEEECLSNEIRITATGKAHDLATRATHQLKVHTELSHLTITEIKPRSSIKLNLPHHQTIKIFSCFC